MSKAEEISEAGAAERYPSLEALTDAHVKLLEEELRPGDKDPGRFHERVREFLARGQATGKVLDKSHERQAAQDLLNYWLTVLYRAQDSKESIPYSVLATYSAAAAEKSLEGVACPYIGLSPFRAADRELFFGRERMTTNVVNHLAGKPLLVIIGPSGSGKSSLLHAGLLPALEDGKLLPESKGWRRYPPIMPGRSPLASLSQMLQSQRPEGEAGTPPDVEALKQSGTALREYLDRVDAPLTLLGVDQFEEVFTICKSDEERDAFINNLLDLVNSPDARHKLVLTMRSDRAGYVLRRPELTKRFHEAEVRLPPLTEEEMRSAVEGPANKVGLVVKPGVVEQLIKEIYGDPSGLPLLQFTLLKLWEQKEHGSTTLAALRRLGDCREALANCADEFYTRLETLEKQEVAHRILLKMVRLSEGLNMTVNRVRRGELFEALKNPEHINDVLERLDAAHLVRVTKAAAPAPDGPGAAAGNGHGAGEPSADDQFELAHESLMYNWPRLEDWLKQAREAMILQQHLESYVAEWVLHGRAQDALLDKYKLYEADLWLKEHDPAESAYGDDLRKLISASRAAIARAKRVRTAMMTALVVALAIAVLLAWRAFTASRRAFSRQLAAQALINKGERLDLALLLSLEAIGVEKNNDISSVSYNSLLQTLNHSPRLNAFLYPCEPGAKGCNPPGVKGVAFDASGSKMASYDEQGTVIIWDVEGRRELRRFPTKKEGERPASTAFSLDGSTLALRYRDGNVALWDVNTGEPQRVINISPPKKGTGQRGQRDGGPAPPEARLVGTIVYAKEQGFVEERGNPEERDSGIAFSTDGRVLIANYPDEGKTVLPWDVGGSGVKEVPVLAGQKRPQANSGLEALAQTLSPGLKKLAVVSKESSGGNGRVEVLAEGGASRPISLPGVLQAVDGVESLSFSPDEKMLACLYRDFDGVHTLVLWNIESSYLLFASPIRPTNNPRERMPLIAFASDGRLAIASSVGNVTMLDSTRQIDPEGLALLPTGNSGVVNSIAFDPGGRRLVAGYQDGIIQLWDYSFPRGSVGNIEPYQHKDYKPPVSALIFGADDGRLISAGLGGEGMAVSRVVSGYQEDKHSAGNFSLRGAADITFSPDGKVAALKYDDDGDRVVLRDTSGWVERGEFKEEENKSITTTALSGAGERLAIGYDDGSATVWEVGGKRRLHSVPGGGQGELQIYEVASIAITADGTRYAVASGDTIRLSDVNKGDTAQLPEAAGETEVTGLVFSPDGRQLISLDSQGAITFRDLSGKPQAKPLTFPGLDIVSITFITGGKPTGGKLMVAATRAGEGILWNLETHRQLGKILLDKKDDFVSALAYRSSDNLLAAGYSSGQIILLDLGLEKLKEIAGQIANRRLTVCERSYYHLSKGDWSYLGLVDLSDYIGGGQGDTPCSDLP